MPGFALSEHERTTYFREPLTGIEDLFLAHKGRLVHKWTHYLPIYHQLFAPYKNRAIRFLEIGISGGGSIELWRRFLGDLAKIGGIDIAESCRDRVDLPNQVFIGSQADEKFLKDVVRQFGRPTIVLDDGSHIASHQRTSFETLFPFLEHGGLYIIEDTHTSYWQYDYEGGYRKRGTAIEYFKQLIDDMHGWYHDVPVDALIRDNVQSIRFYDSIIVVEKAEKLPPRHHMMGEPI